MNKHLSFYRLCLVSFFMFSFLAFTYSQHQGFIRQYDDELGHRAKFVLETAETYEIAFFEGDSLTGWIETDTTAFPYEAHLWSNQHHYISGQIIDSLETGGFQMVVWAVRMDIEGNELWRYESNPFYVANQNGTLDIHVLSDSLGCVLNYQNQQVDFPKIIRISGEGVEVHQNTYSSTNDFSGSSAYSFTAEATYQIEYEASPFGPSAYYWINKRINGLLQYTVYYSNLSYGPFLPTSDGGLILAETGASHDSPLQLKKYDAMGSLEWKKTYPFHPNLQSIQVAENGEYLLTGSLNGKTWVMKTGIGAVYPAPDHIVSEIYLPAGSTVAPNTSLPSLVEHQNLNPNPDHLVIEEPLFIGFYLSTDEVWDEEDILLMEQEWPVYHSFQPFYALPIPDVEAGCYYVIAYVDHYDWFMEVDENNNFLAANINISTTQEAANFSITKDTICQGESYFFNEQLFFESGKYADTTISAQGCDSIFYLDLLVLEPVAATIQDTICQGESYNFFGDTLTLPDIYSTVLTTVSGCDSLLELELEVLRRSQTTVFLDLEVGMVFQDIPIFADTFFVEHFTNINGCDSTVTTEISILTSVEADFQKNNHLNIWPNPSSQDCYLELELAQSQMVDISIVDAWGRSMPFITTSRFLSQGKHRLLLSTTDWPAGVYWVLLSAKHGRLYQKLLLL